MNSILRYDPTRRDRPGGMFSAHLSASFSETRFESRRDSTTFGVSMLGRMAFDNRIPAPDASS
jgi:hypothetical protein